MKDISAIIFSAACSLLLSACTATSNNQNVSTPTPLKSGTNTAQSAIADRKTNFFDGIVIASTNNPCIDHFNFIRSTRTETYKNYASKYAKIGEGYRFLNVNKNIMGEEAKEVYTMQLDLKLDTLCAKAHFTSFQIVKEKMRNLSNI